MLRPRFYGCTHKGKIRSTNEDSLLADAALGIAAVADGMGGHSSGEIASALAVKTLHEIIRQGHTPAPNAPGQQNMPPAARLLAHAVNMANTAIFQAAAQQAARKGMGTTLSAVLIDGDAAHIAHVGDSRVYLLHAGKLEQLTQDHSLVMQQVRDGLLSPQEASQSRFQNVLTRALGIRAEVKPDIFTRRIQQGDTLLICSDGLSKALDDTAIQGILARGSNAAAKLVDKANAAGGPDNISAVVISLTQPSLLEKALMFFRREYTHN